MTRCNKLTGTKSIASNDCGQSKDEINEIIWYK